MVSVDVEDLLHLVRRHASVRALKHVRPEINFLRLVVVADGFDYFILEIG